MSDTKDDVTLYIDSRDYGEANDLTVNLDEEIDNVGGIRIIYAGIPCTFYNISQDIGNNNLLIHDTTAWKYVNIPDGLYDAKTFDKQISIQMKMMGLQPRAIKFDVDETSGKLVISFRKQKGETYKLSVRSYNKNLLGFKTPPNTGLELPIDGKDISIGDKMANFKPFEYYHVHCDLVNTDEILYNGNRSDILARIPVKECEFGERNIHYLTGLRGRKCKRHFKSLRLWITDEDNKPINFNGGRIEYELLFRRGTLP